MKQIHIIQNIIITILILEDHDGIGGRDLLNRLNVVLTNKKLSNISSDTFHEILSDMITIDRIVKNSNYGYTLTLKGKRYNYTSEKRFRMIKKISEWCVILVTIATFFLLVVNPDTNIFLYKKERQNKSEKQIQQSTTSNQSEQIQMNKKDTVLLKMQPPNK